MHHSSFKFSSAPLLVQSSTSSSCHDESVLVRFPFPFPRIIVSTNIRHNRITKYDFFFSRSPLAVCWAPPLDLRFSALLEGFLIYNTRSNFDPYHQDWLSSVSGRDAPGFNVHLTNVCHAASSEMRFSLLANHFRSGRSYQGPTYQGKLWILSAKGLTSDTDALIVCFLEEVLYRIC